jgi:hypothetical protein
MLTLLLTLRNMAAFVIYLTCFWALVWTGAGLFLGGVFAVFLGLAWWTERLWPVALAVVAVLMFREWVRLMVPVKRRPI